MKKKKYTTNPFLISYRSQFVYRGSVVSQIIGSVFRILLTMALWKYVYHYDHEMQKYMILYVIISNVISMFYSGSMGYEIGEKIADGSFAIELIRPVNFLWMNYWKMVGRICAGFVMRGVPVLVCFCPLVIMNRSYVSWKAFPIFCCAVLMGHILYELLYTLIGFIAFVCFEVWAFERLLEDTIRFLSGSFLPLALFPDWLKSVSVFLPFRFLFSFPIEILLGKIAAGEIWTNMVIMILWILGAGGVLALVYKKAVNIFVVQGG